MYNLNRNIVYLTLILTFILVLINFGMPFKSNMKPNISLTEWVAVEPITSKPHKLRFAIASMVSAEETWLTYKKLIDYVSNHLGNKASMVLPPSYSDVRVLLEEKMVDIALICTGTYIACSMQETIELLVVPEFKNGLKYRCLFVVNSELSINNLSGLEGKSFAFTDAESNTGCIVPSWIILKQGKNLKEYFSKIIYTGSHDRSLHAVSKGLVDGAGVDSLIYYSFIETHPELKKRLKIVWESEPFGPPPIVVPTGMPNSKKEKLRNILLTMSHDEVGQEILENIGISHFKIAETKEYDSAYSVWKMINSQ